MTTSLLFSVSMLLAQTSTNPTHQEDYRRWSSLLLLLAILSTLIVTTHLLIVVLRRSRRYRESLTKPKDTKHVDAWAEAGRRFDTSITEIDIEDD